MPLHRRLPKRGFNSPTRDDIAEVRTSELQSMQAAEIDLAALKAAGIVSRKALAAKVIVSGKLERKIVLKEIPVSKGARAMIEAAGGSIQLTEKPKAEPKQDKKKKKGKPAAEEKPATQGEAKA
jgi:large subunit ribosomal protein L15